MSSESAQVVVAPSDGSLEVLTVGHGEMQTNPLRIGVRLEVAPT